MIAPLLIVALVASAQAFPGSDPVSSALSIAPQQLSFGPDSIPCIIGAISQARNILKDMQDLEVPAVINLIGGFGSRAVTCVTTQNVTADCFAQALKDAIQVDCSKQITQFQALLAEFKATLQKGVDCI